VKQNKARGKDVEDWYFHYVSVDGGWGQPVEIDDEAAPQVAAKVQDVQDVMLKAVVRCLQEFMSPPMSEYYTNIVKELKKRMHVGEAKAKEYFNEANSRGVFHLPVSGRYTLDTSQCEAILNDLPFAPMSE
jgi:hypothetical protein